MSNKEGDNLCHHPGPSDSSTWSTNCAPSIQRGCILRIWEKQESAKEKAKPKLLSTTYWIGFQPRTPRTLQPFLHLAILAENRRTLKLGPRVTLHKNCQETLAKIGKWEKKITAALGVEFWMLSNRLRELSGFIRMYYCDYL